MSDSLREKLKGINVFYEAWIPEIRESSGNEAKKKDELK
jgi:hypothetical protein